PRPLGRPAVFLRTAHVGHLPVLRIDLQAPAQPPRETPEQYHGRQAPGVPIEGRAGGRAPFASGDPLRVDAGRAGVFLGGRAGDDVGLLRRVEDLRIVAVRAGNELAVGADPQLTAAPVGRPGRVVGHLGRARGIQAAVVPHHSHFGARSL